MSIPSDGNYNFLLLACTEASPQIYASWDCKNPGGEELSTGQIPLKSLTAGFGWTFATLSALFVVIAVIARQTFAPTTEWLALSSTAGDPSLAEPQLNKAIRPLHYVLFVPPVLMSFSAFVSNAYWRQVSKSGVEDITFALLDVLAWDLGHCFLIAVLLYIGQGWQVTRLRLETYESTRIYLLTGYYAVTLAGFQSFGGFVILFLLILAYVMVMRFMFASVTWSLSLLHTFRAYTIGLAQVTAEEAEENAERRRTNAGVSSTEEQSRREAEDAAASRQVLINNQQVYAQYGYYGTAVAADANPDAGSGTVTAGGSSGVPADQHQDNGGPPAAAAADSSSSDLNAQRAALYSGGSSSGATPAAQQRGTATQQQQPARSWWRHALSRIGVSRRSDNGVYEAIETGDFGRDDDGTGDGGPPAGAAQTMYDGGLTSRQIENFRFYRSAVVTYLTCSVFVQVWGSMGLSTTPWVGYCVLESFSIMMVAYLLFIFRPRSDPSQSPLYDPRGYIGSSSEGLLHEENGGDDDESVEGGDEERGYSFNSGGGSAGRVNVSNLRSATDGMPAANSASIDANGTTTGSLRRYVVVNSDSIDPRTGKIIGPLSIAERMQHQPSSQHHAQATCAVRPNPTSQQPRRPSSGAPPDDSGSSGAASNGLR